MSERTELLKFFDKKPIGGIMQLQTPRLKSLKKLYSKRLYSIKNEAIRNNIPLTYKKNNKRYSKNKSHLIADIFGRGTFYEPRNNKTELKADANGFERFLVSPRKLYTVEGFQNLNNNSIVKFFEAIKYHVQYSEYNREGQFPSIRVQYLNDSRELDWVTLPISKDFLNMQHRMRGDLKVFLSNHLHHILKSQSIDVGSDIIINAPQLVIDKFYLYHLNEPRGGADVPLVECDKNCNHKTIYVQDFVCKSPRNTNNNCLIECFRYITKQKKYTANNIRKKLNLVEGQYLPVGAVPILEEYFNTKVLVITGKNENGELNILHGDIASAKYWLMLNNDHFSIIAKQLLQNNNKIQTINETTNNNKDDERPKKYFMYDYETVWDVAGFLKSYSIVCIVYMIVNNQPKIVDEFIYIGMDSDKQFITYLCKNNNDTYNNILVAYNAARFDHFILAESLFNYGLLSKNSVFIANGSILQLKFLSFKSIDLCRFVMMKLSEACKGYGCKFQKLDFDHSEPQLAYLNNNLNEWLQTNKNKLVKYNKMDVESMAELYFKVDDSIKTLFKADISEYMTLSQLGYAVFRRSAPIGVYPPPANFQNFDFIRSAQIAGRSQIFKKGIFYGAMNSEDIKSMYPYVMNSQIFPKGQEIKTNKYIKGKLGVYNCLIRSQPIPNIIPLRKEGEPLDWTYRGEIRCVLTTVDIDCLRRHKADVWVFDGVYWNESSNDVFKEYITPLKNEKTKQDKLAKESHPDHKLYNPALRAFCKAGLNCLSGKVNQRNYDSDTQLCQQLNDLVSFSKSHKNITFSPLGNTPSIFCKGQRITLNYNPKSVKPCQLGVFIYSYARTHIYDALLCHAPEKLAMDTDSLHLPQSVIDKLKDSGLNKYGTYHKGSEFGDFESELDFVSEKAYYVAPKCYGIFGNNDSKMRFKGVGGNDKLLEGYTLEEFNKLDIKTQYNIYLNAKPALCEKLYDNLCNGRQVNILTQHLQRAIGHNTLAYLKCSFMIKTINPEGIVYYN